MHKFLTHKLFAVLFCLAMPVIADGQESRLSAQKPTELADVLNSANRFYPTILASKAGILEKQAGILEANGSFDPRIDGSVFSRVDGLYDSSYGGARVSRELPFMNAEVFSEYSLSGGDFPTYQNQYLSSDSGKVRLGIALSLLRDRAIDNDRFALQNAEIESSIAELTLKNEQLSIFQQAFIAYNRWLLSARLLASYEELLEVALLRGEALERQVEAGDVAEILLVENRQAILQREGLVIDANRQLQLAAEGLSLYLRNTDGQPVYPLYDSSLPIPVQAEEFLDMPIQVLLENALSSRPDIAAIRSLQVQVQLERTLAENLAKPQLDISFYSSRDLGDSQLMRVGTDNVIELSYSIPLATRTAQGRRDAANAKLDGLEHELYLLVNETERDIRSAILNLRATSELKDIALQELEVAQALVNAEARRFEAGNSDFLSLNVRERMLGEAQLRRWQAELNHQIALANYYGVSMDLPDYE